MDYVKLHSSIVGSLLRVIFRLTSDYRYIDSIETKNLGYKPDLKNPKTFNEKLNWLKLHDHNPIYHKMVDKYEVKSIVKEKIGDGYTAKCLGIYENLKDIDFAAVRAPLNFGNLSKTQCKKLDGIPVFADVRGFTCQFEEDDSNLEEMAQKTQQILSAMYQVSTEHGGIHVQFQGDRELSLYHNIPGQNVSGVYQSEQKCFKAAILASMRMIDNVKPYKVHIGVGEDFGRLFATKIGARGEKDNILLGETVILADTMEDKHAGEDQVAITTEVYNGLKSEDANLANQFKKVGNCFIATIGYKEYVSNVSFQQQRTNTDRNNYNGAWGDLI